MILALWPRRFHHSGPTFHASCSGHDSSCERILRKDDNVIGDKHVDIVAGFGAIVPLVSLVAASVPKGGFGSRWSICFSLSLTPTALIGLYDKLRIPEIHLHVWCAPVVFAYPDPM